VSGMLGDAALALAHLQGHIVLEQQVFAASSARLHKPCPRVELGLALRGIASSAIDVSDGLLADLGHILERSQTGAEIRFEALPCSPELHACASPSLVQRCMLAGGDDYELCFTASHGQRARIEEISAQLALPLTRIGTITEARGCTVYENGQVMQIKELGYEHFAR